MGTKIQHTYYMWIYAILNIFYWTEKEIYHDPTKTQPHALVCLFGDRKQDWGYTSGKVFLNWNFPISSNKF